MDAQSSVECAAEAARVAGRYIVLDRIGAGGVGVVYRARDEVSGRVVAFKQLMSAKAGKRARTLEALFEREYHTLVRLRHPRIIEVYDYGVTDDGPYYTMELLEGSDLAQLRRLPYADVCRHLRDVASSLALLHAQRLVHRDVSPRNIKLTADGTARLIDFGALASFGANGEVIGTPPFMAPEVLHGRPLDPRTDLYSLGAVAYFSLTGRHAYPAREVGELPRLWQTPPVPPSVIAPEIPPELDALVLSMLSQDPLARPETAAAVIDQLTVIAQLPPEAHEPAEQSYFLSTPIVGRDTQLTWATGRIQQALAGRGSELVIEGPPGIGKTRLANELCVAGALKGALALRADAESTSASFGVAVLLARRLLEASPEIARKAAEPHVEHLRYFTPLAEAFGTESSKVLVDPAERRARTHVALRDWFLAVSRERTLVVCVDDLQAIDDDSAAFLAALGRESRSANLLLMSTLRSGSAMSETVRMLRERAQRLKLSELDAKACKLLAQGLFGDAANAARVGNLLRERSGGVPRQFIELAQLLVQKKIARYEAGSWVLPLDVAEHELPSDSEGILAARVAELAPDALALAESLAVHSGIIPLAVALAVSELTGEGRTYAALDLLVGEQMLVNEAASYRFRHDGIRDALLRRIDTTSLRAKRLRAAEVLLSPELGGVAERVEAALLLIDAGEEQRGTRTLLAAAREVSAGAGHHNPNRLVGALCNRVRAYDAQGRSDYDLFGLLFPLMPLAYYSSHWTFILEYGERALTIGLRITGLERARQLAAELGPAEAMKRGLGAAAAEFAARDAAELGYDHKTAIGATIGIVASCVAIYATVFDVTRVSRIASAAEALAYFGKEHVAYGMYLFAQAEERIIGGRDADSVVFWDGALARFEHPAFGAAVGEVRAKALQGGSLFAGGIMRAYRFGEEALEFARRMDALGIKAWEVTADLLRVLYHSLRGESVIASTYVERVEANVVQGAQTWQAEMFWPVLLLNGDLLASDAMAARRRYVQLDRRGKDIETLRVYAEAAHAGYLMLRGDLAGAIAQYEAVLPLLPVRRAVAWETTRGHFARALNATGQHDRARAIALEVIENMTPADEAHVTHFLEAKRQLALAESALGHHDVAARMLDDLLAAHGGQDQPLLVGLLHQARAEVAERAGDGVAAALHRREMESRFRATRNPALIAQCERANIRPATHGAVPPIRSRLEAVATVSGFTAGHGPTLPSAGVNEAPDDDEQEPGTSTSLDDSLRRVMRETRARRAYLYVSDGDNLELTWTSGNGQPPAACVEELGRWLDVARENENTTHTKSGVDQARAATVTAFGHRFVALEDDEGKVIGGLVLELEAEADLVLTRSVFEGLVRVVGELAPDTLGLITA